MNQAAKFLMCFSLVLAISNISSGQVLKSLGNRVKAKVNQRVSQRADEAIDKGLDKAERVGKDAGKKDGTAKNPGGQDNSEASGTGDSDNASASNNNPSSSKEAGGEEKTSFEVYSKYDFIPGEKLFAFDDFSKDEVGDFPVAWNTNSAGEVVTSSSQPGHWLMVRKQGRFIPEYVKSLPDNFTVEYDVVCNDQFSYYSPALSLYFLSGDNKKGVFESSFILLDSRSGVRIGVHPANTASNGGIAYVENFEDGASIIKNQVPTTQFNSLAGKTKLHVSIWRQKQRLRVYLNEEKVYDLPRAFAAGKTYGTVLFDLWGDMFNDKDRYLVSNIKFASGAPDTRNKLLTEGRFVTRGILFDVNSDKIKPESYGVLKDIANVLAENESVKVKIIGHTDSDGSDADNMTLSKRRAESVRNCLAKEFGIAASRFETDGKGESQPADTNTTPEAKANNRRVEFVKL